MRVIKYITRTTHSEALIVKGAGYDVDNAGFARQPMALARWPNLAGAGPVSNHTIRRARAQAALPFCTAICRFSVIPCMFPTLETHALSTRSDTF